MIWRDGEGGIAVGALVLCCPFLDTFFRHGVHLSSPRGRGARVVGVDGVCDGCCAAHDTEWMDGIGFVG